MNVEEKWPVLGWHGRAAEWLTIWTNLGRAPRTELDGFVALLTHDSSTDLPTVTTDHEESQ